MSQIALRWITILIILVMTYLIVRNADQFKRFVNAATGAQVGTIVALQGGKDPTRFLQ